MRKLREVRGASFTDFRRRALSLVDVVAESDTVGPLHLRGVVVSLAISWFYWSYTLPISSTWGTGRWVRDVSMGLIEPQPGGPGAEVHWAVCVLITLAYLWHVLFGVRFMERREPVQKHIFEGLIVYNLTQALLNLRLTLALLQEVWALGYELPWGNALDASERGHKLGMLLWFQYHCRQLDLFDTSFMILRKKFQRISFVHVYLRLLNLWGWFIACRFACGGDTYFPAVVNAACQVIVYTYYLVHLLRPDWAPSWGRACVSQMQVLQFVICTAHAVFVLLYGNIPRAVVAFNLFIMANGLAFYIDFDDEHPRLGPRRALKPQDEGFGKKSVTVCFDSSGWLYCYHFGVAKWIQEHMLPEGLTCAEAVTDKYPSGLAFSGSSGGSLVAGALGSGINISDLFEYVMMKQPDCRMNPWKIFAALEGAMDTFLPENAGSSMSGRVRVLLTRISTKFPFCRGEIVDQYSDREDAWHTMRASCHIPGIFFKAYKLHGRFYFDGLLWGSFFVPWASDDSYTIRVSALSRPLTDISAPLQPMWWALFPPPVDVLRGMYWRGYQDAARYFSNKPANLFDLCMCRSQRGSNRDEEVEKMTSQASVVNNKQLKHKAAQKLIIKSSATNPVTCPVTGREVDELVGCYTQAVQSNIRALGFLLGAIVVVLLASELHSV